MAEPTARMARTTVVIAIMLRTVPRERLGFEITIRGSCNLSNVTLVMQSPANSWKRLGFAKQRSSSGTSGPHDAFGQRKPTPQVIVLRDSFFYIRGLTDVDLAGRSRPEHVNEVGHLQKIGWRLPQAGTQQHCRPRQADNNENMWLPRRTGLEPTIRLAN